MRKGFFSLLCIVVVMVVGCRGGCRSGIERIETEEGVLYQDKRTHGIVINYWDENKDGSLQKRAIATRKGSRFYRSSSPFKSEIISVDINDDRQYMSVDSLWARQCQDEYNELRASFSTTEGKAYPEDQIQSRPEVIKQFGLWLQEYHNNASAPVSSDVLKSSVQEFHTYLAFIGMEYWYFQFNWLEKLSVFKDPEAAGIFKLEFMRRGDIRAPLREQFEVNIKLLSEDMSTMATRLQIQGSVDVNVEDYKYRKACEKRGLRVDSFKH